MMSTSAPDTAAASLQALTGLLRIVSDPKAVAAEIEELKAAVAEHKDTLAIIEQSKAEAKAAIDQIGEAKRGLETARGDAMRVAVEARERQRELGESAAALAAAQSEHANRTAAETVLLRTERSTLEAEKADHAKRVSAHEADHRIREDRLASKEKDLADREAALVAKEAAAQEILDRVAVLGERAKKAS